MSSKLKTELSSPHSIPSLDVDACWSSTFLTVRQEFNCRRVINVMIVRLEDPYFEAISKTERSTCDVVCKFLQSAAEITDVESGSSYVTLKKVKRAYSHLNCVCTDASLQNCKALHDISQRMSSKQKRYKIHLCSPVANLSRVLDPRFSNDIL